MSYKNVYIGATEELRLLKGDSVIGFTFTVLNENDSEYDFTGYSDQNLYIWAKSDKVKLLKTIPAASLVIVDNVITWTSADYAAAIGLNTGKYYYMLTYEDESSRPITVVKGIFRIV